MKIKINTQIIKDLNPCMDRYKNWMKHYSKWSGDILEFLALPDEIITPQDKILVSVRVMPRSLVEYFAFDMAVDAATAATAADYAAAATAATAAAYAAEYAAYAAEYAAAAYAAEYAAYAAEYAAAATAADYAAAATAATADAAREKQWQKALDTIAYLVDTANEKEMRNE